MVVRREAKQRPPRRRLAFTLAEMAAVLAVVGILSAIAIPRFSASTARHRAEMAARRLAADLELARRNARMLGQEQVVQFNTSTETYTLVGMTHPDHPASGYAICLADEPYAANIVRLTPATPLEARFDAFGAAAAGVVIEVRVADYSVDVGVSAESGLISCGSVR